MSSNEKAVPSDVEIAQSSVALPIAEVAAGLGLEAADLFFYGNDVAKVALTALDRPRPRPRPRTRPGRLVLVSAITPTAAGEGKTTTSIGLADGLSKLGESVCLALREPSLGPSLGMKGGATGGGYSQLLPMERINLHFTGDFHAITTANNLLAALIDNHLHQGNRLRIDPRRVLWRRVMDMNDRALRQIVLGLGGPKGGIPREGGFDITAASEIMAILCLADGIEDLRKRLDRILVGFNEEGEPVLASEIGGTGALLVLLQDAIRPNLVQTLEGTPALVHGGPFANIAHGCSSVLATRLGLHQADWVITEAGFGFDLGAEKFFDIKCAGAGLDTAAVVLVATARALKMHGGVDRKDLGRPDPDAVSRGLPNLEKHIENIQCFTEVPIVALNRFAADSEEEIEVVRRRCVELGVPFAVSDHHRRGGEGAAELARAVLENAERESSPFRTLYERDDSVVQKIEAVASKMYGAEAVVFTAAAKRDLTRVARLGYSGLPVCIAKIPGSLSDDPRRWGRPRDFEITVRGVEINAGAGFLVVLTGDILRMPGLPRKPLAEAIDLQGGRIVGLE
jgi:formate--tetrahydrofolate ligase